MKEGDTCCISSKCYTKTGAKLVDDLRDLSYRRSRSNVTCTYRSRVLRCYQSRFVPANGRPARRPVVR